MIYLICRPISSASDILISLNQPPPHETAAVPVLLAAARTLPSTITTDVALLVATALGAMVAALTIVIDLRAASTTTTELGIDLLPAGRWRNILPHAGGTKIPTVAITLPRPIPMPTADHPTIAALGTFLPGRDPTPAMDTHASMSVAGVTGKPFLIVVWDRL